MHRLVEPNWPVSIHEYLGESGHPNLHRADSVHDGAGRFRSRPLSAAMVDTRDGSLLLGYPVVLRDAAKGSEHEVESGLDAEPEAGIDRANRNSRPFPSATAWRPDDDDACEIGVLVDGAMLWLECSEVTRVLRPNAMPWTSRLAAAVDRLRRDRPDVTLEPTIPRS